MATLLALFWISAPFIFIGTMLYKLITIELEVSGKPFLIFLSIILLIGFTSPIYVEYFHASNDQLLTIDDSGQIELSEYVAFCWDECIHVPKDFYGRSKVTLPASLNGQDFSYLYKIKMADYAKIIDVFGNNFTEIVDSPEIEKKITYMVESLVYEFNNSHAQEFSAFYNPNDYKQIEQLDKMFTAFINPQLEFMGVKVEILMFKIS